MTDREYITVLAESLKKKSYLLDKIVAKNEEQKQALEDEHLTVEDFDRIATEKDDLISEISKLDDGFEEIYDRVKDILEKDRASYKEEITKMQELIRRITAKDASIRTAEQRNFQLAQKKFADVRKQVKEAKASQKMVNTYYQNMMRQATIEPSYYDNKK